MSHWAEIDENNIVLRVVVADNNDPAGDEGYSFLTNNLGGNWVKTSYNTLEGIHYGADGKPDNGTPLRKNYAAIGMIYDSKLDAFYVQQPYPSWILDGETCTWKPPVPRPEETESMWYKWDEQTLSWKSFTKLS
jgi:hypothetical protein